MSLVSAALALYREEGPAAFAREGYRFAKWKARGLRYRLGSGRKCPLCGFTGRRFMPTGDPARPDAQCPRCGALERTRLLWYYLANETDVLASGQRILFVAPNRTVAERLTAAGNDVVTIDLKRGRVAIQADLTALPFAAGAFDAIICTHVLEHIPDDQAAMEEMRRVLAADGDAFVMVPKDTQRATTREDPGLPPATHRQQFGQETHVRLYGRDIVDRLTTAGFDVRIKLYAQRLTPTAVEYYGLRVQDRQAYFGPSVVDAEPPLKYETIHHLTPTATTDEATQRAPA